jgi:hypothetical protein
MVHSRSLRQAEDGLTPERGNNNNPTMTTRDEPAMTHYEQLVPVAAKLIQGLAAKPGIHFSDRNSAAEYLAQALAGMIARGEICKEKTDL